MPLYWCRRTESKAANFGPHKVKEKIHMSTITVKDGRTRADVNSRVLSAPEAVFKLIRDAAQSVAEDLSKKNS